MDAPTTERPWPEKITVMDICFFCGREPADIASTVDQPIYHLDRYAHLGVARRFEYTKMIVPICRCARCALLHRQLIKRRKRGVAVGAVIGFFIGMPIPGAVLFTAIGGGFVGHVIAVARGRKSLRASASKGLDAGSLSLHPLVGEKLRTGWRLRKP